MSERCQLPCRGRPAQNDPSMRMVFVSFLVVLAGSGAMPTAEATPGSAPPAADCCRHEELAEEYGVIWAGHGPDDDHRAPGGLRRARALVLSRRAPAEAAQEAGDGQGQGDRHPRALPLRGRPRRADRLLPGAADPAAGRRAGSGGVRREPGPARAVAGRPREDRRHRPRLLLLLLDGLRRRRAPPRRRVHRDADRGGPSPELPGVPVGARPDAGHRQGPRHPVVRQHHRPWTGRRAFPRTSSSRKASTPPAPTATPTATSLPAST